MGDPRPIGVFDSGIGGLTVIQELFRQLPGESVIYFGDTARVPYGAKSVKAVQHFSMQNAAFLMKHHVKMIVVACHTASALAMDVLIQNFHLPIVGVTEPGVEAALKKTVNGRIGIIGTRGTIQSGTYARTLAARNPGVIVTAQACPLFVPLAEEGWLDTDVTRQTAEIYLERLGSAGIDTLILACTHYPLLKNVIGGIMGSKVELIDSAEETARAVKSRLKKEDLTGNHSNPEYRFFVSDIPLQFQEIGDRFLGRRLGKVEQVDIESVQIS
jgi:glutamate racemase